MCVVRQTPPVRTRGEARNYTPGNCRTVVEYKGFRFLLLVCYDLRFPVWSRCRCDYDAILCCASWPAPRREVWQTLLRARAIENQCYVAGVNRVGDDPSAHYAGDSALVDFKGRTLAEAGDGEQILTARSTTGRWRHSVRNSPPGGMRMISGFNSDFGN